MEIVNIVGSGSIGVEVDLQQLDVSVDEFETRYDPEKHPGLYLRFVEDGPLVTLYRTGKYNISGIDTERELMDVRRQFLKYLTECSFTFVLASLLSLTAYGEE